MTMLCCMYKFVTSVNCVEKSSNYDKNLVRPGELKDFFTSPTKYERPRGKTYLTDKI